MEGGSCSCGSDAYFIFWSLNNLELLFAHLNERLLLKKRSNVWTFHICYFRIWVIDILNFISSRISLPPCRTVNSMPLSPSGMIPRLLIGVSRSTSARLLLAINCKGKMSLERVSPGATVISVSSGCFSFSSSCSTVQPSAPQWPNFFPYRTS